MRSIGKTVLSTCAIGALAMTFACSSSSTTATNDDAGDKADAPASGPPLCTSSGKNAYETYQLAGFQAATAEIFKLVGADTSGKLGTSFSKIGTGKDGTPTAALADDAATFEGTLNAFLVYGYGGPSSSEYSDKKTYDGNINLTTAHTGLAITSDQYSYFVSDIVVPALENVGVKSEDVTSCFAPVVTNASFEASIVGH